MVLLESFLTDEDLKKGESAVLKDTLFISQPVIGWHNIL